MICVRCTTQMETVIEKLPHDLVELDRCGQCHGTWFDRAELEITLGIANHQAFAAESPLLTGRRPSFRCPRGCDALTLSRQLASAHSAGATEVVIDQCPLCQGIWLDGEERDQMAQRIREKQTVAFVDRDPDKARMSAGVWLFMFMSGMPVEQWNPVRRQPVVTPTLVALCILSFAIQVITPGGLMSFGVVPGAMSLATSYRLITYMFLHGGLVHLVGNMYFLWVFGDNVEDRLGRARFIGLYFGAGVIGGITHALLTGDPTTPMVGASGAIAGVMAAYAVLFPRTRLISLILFWRVRWRAWAYLTLWLLLNVLGVLSKQGHVAFWAHIGGFAVGLAVAFPSRPRALPVTHVQPAVSG